VLRLESPRERGLARPLEPSGEVEGRHLTSVSDCSVSDCSRLLSTPAPARIDRCVRAKIAAVTLPESVPADVVDLERWRAEWAAALASAVEASLPELAPYTPWAIPAYGIGDARTYIDASIADWDAGLNWNYAIVTRTGEVVGSTGLMTRMGPGVLEIGYWLHTGHAGRGYATAAARALADVGLVQPGVESVLIRHDAANVASGRVAEKAGFVRIAEIASTIDVPEGSGIEVRWERRV